MHPPYLSNTRLVSFDCHYWISALNIYKLMKVNKTWLSDNDVTPLSMTDVVNYSPTNLISGFI